MIEKERQKGLNYIHYQIFNRRFKKKVLHVCFLPIPIVSKEAKFISQI